MTYAEKVILVVTVMAPWFAAIGLTFGVVAFLERKQK